MKRVIAATLDPFFAFSEFLTKHKKTEFLVGWVTYSAILLLTARHIWEWQYWLILVLLLFLSIKEYISGHEAAERIWKQGYDALVDACIEARERSKRVKKLR